MNIILSFIGPLPSYIIECVQQIRLYTNNDIYLILNDYNSIYLEKLEKYNVKMCKYESVFDQKFAETMNTNIQNFWYIDYAKGREQIFIRSLERFYLANNLINLLDLNNNLFIEIDNLIYDNPNNWLSILNNYNIAYMAHSSDHCASGIMFIKNKNSLKDLLEYLTGYIQNAKYSDCPNEMKAIFQYYKNNKDKIHILPTIFDDKINEVSSIAYENYNLYDSIFDGAAYGIYLGGEDPIHNKGEIIYNKSFDHFIIKCKNYEIKFEEDPKDFYKKPYIYDFNKNKWILINNLHIHSKLLKNHLSTLQF
jgi:hypothetical protein